MPGLIVPCAVAILAGVATSARWPQGGTLAALLAISAAASGVASWRLGRRLLGAALVTAAMWPAGWWLGARAHEQALRRPVRAVLAEVLSRAREGEVAYIEGRLREDALQYESGVSLTIDLSRVSDAGRWLAVTGGVRLSVAGEVEEAVRSGWRRGRCIRTPAVLRVPASFRNPGVADADLQLARRHLDLVGSVKSATLVETCGDGGPWYESAGLARDVLRRAIARHVAPHHALSAAIVGAILVGDRAAITDEVEERLRRAGTFHVIAISGGNVAILTGVLLWCTIALAAPPRTAALLTVAGLLAYAAIVVRGASVDRAVIVALVYLLARMADVRAHPLALLASVAVALVLLDPLVVFDVGFALTFGATAGLVVVTPVLLGLWDRGVGGPETPSASAALRAARPVLALLLATVGAETAVLPVAAVAFGRVTYAGLLLNFLAIPLMTVIQVAGLIVAATSHLVPIVADVAGYVAHLAVTGMLESARLVDVMPWMDRVVPPPALWLVCVYLGAMILACAGSAADAVRLTSAGMASVALAAITLGWVPARSETFARSWPHRSMDGPLLRLTVLDVGQGDAVLVEFPGGAAMLVDTGGLAAAPRFDIGRRVVSPALHALGVSRLWWLVLTHGDPDHIGGAAAILADWRPREIWEGVPVARHEPLRALRDTAARLGLVWRQARAGDELSVGGTTLRVWHPGPPEWERQRVRNDDSVVIELEYGDVSLLLPGDIGSTVEQQLAPRARPGRVTILKAAHHGSAGSSDASWLRAVRPAVVIYSAGQGNRFGHPAPAAVRRAREVGAELFRTDEDGAVQVATDGRRITVTTMQGRQWRGQARVLPRPSPDPSGFRAGPG